MVQKDGLNCEAVTTKISANPTGALELGSLSLSNTERHCPEDVPVKRL